MDVYTERTLLISGSEKGLDAIINFLKGCGYAAVSVVSSGDEARRMLQQDTLGLVVAKPLNRAALLQAIRMGKAMHGRMMHMKAENDKLQKKLEELRCVSRAKCILIEREQYTEEQAHRYIEKLAMDTRRNRREVAMEILSRYVGA